MLGKHPVIGRRHHFDPHPFEQRRTDGTFSQFRGALDSDAERLQSALLASRTPLQRGISSHRWDVLGAVVALAVILADTLWRLI